MHAAVPDTLTLRVFAVAGAQAVTRELYEDAGEGYGPSSRRTLECDGEALRIGARAGDYVPRRLRFSLDWRGRVGGVEVDGRPHDFRGAGGLIDLEERAGATEVVMRRP